MKFQMLFVKTVLNTMGLEILLGLAFEACIMKLLDIQGYASVEAEMTLKFSLLHVLPTMSSPMSLQHGL